MIRFLSLLVVAVCCWAHVGSPDVYFDGKAGPYQCYVTVRTPQVIPGVAEIEIRIPSNEVDAVKIAPMPLTGPGAKFAPTPDVATRSSFDPYFYTGSLWMMSTGSWQVRVTIEGKQGPGELRVPVPALSRRTLEMDQTLGAILFGLMLFLAVGAVSIAGAATREGKLDPGLDAPPENRQRAWIVMGITAVLVAGAIYLGDRWWVAEASGYARSIFKPLGMETSVDGNRLTMKLKYTGWLQSSNFDDLVPDHGYPMHLFVVTPNLDRMWHLHPEMISSGVFTKDLPAMPAGRYQLFGDIVHRSGLPETVTAYMDTPSILKGDLTGDDSTNLLSVGYRMALVTPGPYRVKKLQPLKVQLLDPKGQPAKGMELYLGMPAHAAIIKRDRTVFTHLHPSGTVPMASLELAARQSDSSSNPHAGHMMQTELPAEVTFPYGFPEPGDYRFFVQMKRAGMVETGLFDVTAVP